MILIFEDGVRTGLINATNNVTYSPVFIGIRRLHVWCGSVLEQSQAPWVSESRGHGELRMDSQVCVTQSA